MKKYLNGDYNVFESPVDPETATPSTATNAISLSSPAETFAPNKKSNINVFPIASQHLQQISLVPSLQLETFAFMHMQGCIYLILLLPSTCSTEMYVCTLRLYYFTLAWMLLDRKYNVWKQKGQENNHIPTNQRGKLHLCVFFSVFAIVW